MKTIEYTKTYYIIVDDNNNYLAHGETNENEVAITAHNFLTFTDYSLYLESLLTYNIILDE